jgi:hypothetical protein
MLKSKWLFLGLIMMFIFSSCSIFYPCHCPKISKAHTPATTYKEKIS